MPSTDEGSNQVKQENLGTYRAASGDIKAVLNLQLERGCGDWYFASFRFYTPPVYRGNKQGFSVRTHYVVNVFEEIFARVKRAEEGIEHLLRTERHPSWDWRVSRDVIRCILSLEDQTRSAEEIADSSE